MTRRNRRVLLVLAGLGLLGGAVALVLTALNQNIIYFYGPSDLESVPVAEGQRIRLGGLVEEGSVVKGDGQKVGFAVTDGAARVAVSFTGLLPDLFSEGQGVVTEGRFAADGMFQADSVLAKHDETYMPPDVADALKRAGAWRGDGGHGDGDGQVSAP